MRIRYVVALIVFLLVTGIGMGAVAGIYLDRQVLSPVAPPPQVPQDALPYFQLIGQAWTLIEQQYVDRDTAQPEALAYGAIGGMVDALGDVGHSRFLNPEMVKGEADFSRAEFEGVGLGLGSKVC